MVEPDIMYLKEFYQLRQIIPETKKIIDGYIDYTDIKMPQISNTLKLQGHQQFIKNLLNPLTPYKRLLLNHGTGTGKSLVINTIAAEYINYFKKMKQQPQVTIIGFTERIIVRDLVKFPELGYITLAEIEERLELSKSPYERDKLRLRGLKATITRRIVNKAQGGYYKFYGYQQFTQELIHITSLGLENKIQYSYIYEDENELEKRIKDLEEKKYIILNKTLLNSLKNGFIACDEAHLLYSKEGKNSRGMAIKYVLDYLEKEDPESSPRIMYVTATPLTGSPTEIISLMELLIPNSRFDIKDFFTEKDKLKPNSLDKIKQICKGYVSFLKDTDRNLYPRRILMGNAISNISYLKFIQCPMSSFQEKTLRSYKSKDPMFSTLLSTDTLTLYDISFPNPENPNGTGNYPGLYTAADIIKKIDNAPVNWRKHVGIEILDGVATGSFLNRENIGKYSSKYLEMLKELLAMLKEGLKGKILIYHYYITSGGLLLIRNMLLENGFLDQTASPISTSICSICGIELKNHPSKSNKYVQDHAFHPTRILLMYGELSAAEMEEQLNLFNDANNIDGYQYRALLGSRAINEGYDFKEIRYMYIMSLPKDISTMLQVFGRAIRRGSHQRLVPDQRFVKIYIFVSVFFKINEISSIAPEVLKYYRKIQTFLEIQEIEKVLREYAIDNFINYHKMASLVDHSSLDGLSFKPAIKFHPDRIKIPTYLDNYYTDNYIQYEINELIIIIKKLFSHQPIWTYEDLIKEIRNPRIIFNVPYDHLTFNESSIKLAMYFLLQNSDLIINNITDVTYNTQIPYIILSNEIRTIVYLEPYYILVPVDDMGIPLIDYNQWFIPNTIETDTNISLTHYWKTILVKEELKIEVEDMLKKYKNDYYLSLIEVYIPVHNYIAQEIIKSAPQSIPKYSLLEKAYEVVGFLLYKKDLINKDIISNLKITSLNQPIGYRNSIISFIYLDKHFEEVSSNLFFSDSRQENNKIVGFFKQKSKTYDFLIRQPIEQVEIFADRRKIKSGSVCSTYTAKRRADFALMLGIKTDILDDICEEIKLRMLKLEIGSRKDPQKNRRWLYFPFDIMTFI